MDSWADHIDDLLDAQWETMADGHQWSPHPDSPLEKIRSRLQRHYGPGGDWDGSDADWAGRLVTLHLAVAGQHLEGIRALLTSRTVIIPMAPLARAIVEAAGRAFWLLNTQHSSVRRLSARLWMIRLDDATRRARTAKGWGPHSSQKAIEKLVREKQRIRKDVIPGRFYGSEISNTDGRLVLCQQEIPGFSASVTYVARGMQLSEDFHTPMYAYLSDASHPSPYSAFEMLRPGEGEDDWWKWASDMQREYMIWQSAVHAYQQLWLLATVYFGHDQEQVLRVCDRWDRVLHPDGME